MWCSCWSASALARWRRVSGKDRYDGELYIDPSSDGHVKTALQSTQAVAYQYMGLQRGVDMVMDPRTAKIGAELADGGTLDWADLVDKPDTDEDGKIMEWAGDPFQVGGTFVLQEIRVIMLSLASQGITRQLQSYSLLRLGKRREGKK